MKRRKILSILLAFILSISLAMPTFAAEIPQAEEIPDKQKNIERCLKKEKDKRKLCSRIKRKSAAALKNVFLKEYIHEKQF